MSTYKAWKAIGDPGRTVIVPQQIQDLIVSFQKAKIQGIKFKEYDSSTLKLLKVSVPTKARRNLRSSSAVINCCEVKSTRRR